MSFWLKTVTKLGLALSIFGSAPAWAGASMTGFELRHCTDSQKCLSLTGPRAEQSLLTKMWVIKNSTVIIHDGLNKRELKHWTDKTVYFDETTKEVIVKDPVQKKEFQINLDDLTVAEYKL